MEQARALGQSSQWDSVAKFWRMYSSDLPRTRQTTQILLQSLLLQRGTSESITSICTDPHLINNNQNAADSNDSPVLLQGVFFDSRLRELAKGARQGLPKRLTYGEALQVRQQQIESGEMDADAPIPLLETEDDAWNRIVEWLEEVVSDALVVTTQRGKDEEMDVLVIAHSGLLRVFLHRLLPPERLRSHADATYDPVDGKFAIPNASLTILTLSCSSDDDDYDSKKSHKELSAMMDSVDITLLTSTKHYDELREIAKTR